MVLPRIIKLLTLGNVDVNKGEMNPNRETWFPLAWTVTNEHIFLKWPFDVDMTSVSMALFCCFEELSKLAKYLSVDVLKC
jgi:hypothetical protein